MEKIEEKKFRKMRRKKQQLPENESIAILKNATSGVLAVVGDHDYPYTVPLSYVYDNGKIYFHCAKSGHKLDAIQRNCKGSFCVVEQDNVIPEEYTTYFKSVIAFGKIRILEDEKEKYAAIQRLAARYTPNDSKEGRQNAINKEYHQLCMLEFSVEHMSGKASIEYIRSTTQTK